MVWAAATPILDRVSVGDVWDTVGGWFGGDEPHANWVEMYQSQNPGRLCPGSPDPHAAARAVAADPNAFKSIRDQLAKSNGGMAPTLRDMMEPGTAELWVTAVMGGGDCENKSAPWMVPLLQRLVTQLDPGPGTSSGTGSGSRTGTGSGSRTGTGSGTGSGSVTPTPNPGAGTVAVSPLLLWLGLFGLAAFLWMHR